MKKKFLILSLSLIGLLSACTPLYDIISSDTGGSSPGADISSSDSSSYEAPIAKTEIAYNYHDYSKGNIALQPACPSIGSPKILIIPVWFTDSETYLPSDTYKENVRQDMGKAFLGTPEETGWHSVSSFYKEDSSGKLTFTGTLASSWYECGLESAYVGSNTLYSSVILLGAVDWYFENNPSDDRASYDLDKDGFIDAVSLIYAAPDRQVLNDPSLVGLWGYCSWVPEGLAQRDVDNPGACTYFWASYDFLYSEKNALQRTGSNYHNGASEGFTADNSIDAHTFIHEFGHVLGLDDYYDVNQQYKPAGDFIMEDNNVGGHDPYSIMALGWANPYIPTESMTITIGAYRSTKDFILLTPEWNSLNSPFDEYLLLELYTPTGLNELDTKYSYKGKRTTGASETGIRLWHVDARLAPANIKEDGVSYDLGEPTVDPYPEGYKVFKAFPNTYWKEGGTANQYISIYGQQYSDYNTLQLIRNNKAETYRPTNSLSNADLFKSGDSFSMSEYSSQFVGGTNLNKGAALGWSFSVSINGSGDNATATINLTKE